MHRETEISLHDIRFKYCFILCLKFPVNQVLMTGNPKQPKCPKHSFNQCIRIIHNFSMHPEHSEFPNHSQAAFLFFITFSNTMQNTVSNTRIIVIAPISAQFLFALARPAFEKRKYSYTRKEISHTATVFLAPHGVIS